jgi:phosphoglycerol transferase MdoB-like AlkP superfamily enzyme
LEIKLDSKIIILLQKICWFIGIVIICTAAFNIATQVHGAFGLTAELANDKGFFFQFLGRTFFSALEQAFLLFLVASILDCIFLNQPLNLQATDLFVRLACIGLIGGGVIDIVTWAQSVFYALPLVNFIEGRGLMNLIGSIMRIFSCLVSFIYAVVIFVFYKNFSRMNGVS